MPVGDPNLAKTMQGLNLKAPMEAVLGTDILATATNLTKLGARRVIADLACGHQAVVRMGIKRARCKLCHEMILNGEDYDAFRNKR